MAESKHFSENQFTLKEVFQNLREWFAFFFSQWKILILAGVVGMGLGALFSIFKIRYRNYQNLLYFCLFKIIDSRLNWHIITALISFMQL